MKTLNLVATQRSKEQFVTQNRGVNCFFCHVLWISIGLLIPTMGVSQERNWEDYEQRISALPYYSYGKGLGMTSPDSIYQLNIRFRMQNRASFNHSEDEVGIDAQIRRLRLRFDGYVGNPRFTYAIQLSFAPGDLGGAIEDGQNLNVIRDAVFFYQLNQNWSIGFGQTKLPGNRQRVNSSGALQLTDRSINNAMFNIDRDMGLQVTRSVKNWDAFAYNIKTAISQGEGRNFTSNNDLNLAYTAKVEIFPFGNFARTGEYFEGDIFRETSPKLLVSASYHYNNKAKKSQGQLGEFLIEQRDLEAFFADVMFKYKGLAFMTAFMQRKTSDPLTYHPSDPTDIAFVRAGQGLDLQGSYLTKRSFEWIGRYSIQNMDDAVNVFLPDMKQYTVGLTYYIWEHSFKLQSEVTYTRNEVLDGSANGGFYARMQVEMGI